MQAESREMLQYELSTARRNAHRPHWGELSDERSSQRWLIIPSSYSIKYECSYVKFLSNSPVGLWESMPRLFGAKVRYQRTQQGLSQLELARRLGLAQHTHVNHIEAGRRAASLGLLLRIADVLSVTTDYLLRDSILVEQPVATLVPQAASNSLKLFGAKIYFLRSRRGITQTDLTKLLGLSSQGYISKLEAGTKEPSLNLVVQIAESFGVTIEYLLSDTIPLEEPVLFPNLGGD